jgi:tyrosinase
VSLTDAGRLGGYFYNVYLNLPVQGVSPGSQDSYFIGTLGPFEIAGAMHHGSTARLVYPATRKLAEVTSPNDQVGALTVSLVRVNGANTPQGPTINIGEARIEISGDEVE